jgi:hypothetical protein
MTAKKAATDVAPYAASEVRAYLRENGVEVGTRGRINREHFVAYLEAEPERAKEIAAELGTKGVEATATAMSRPRQAPGRQSR